MKNKQILQALVAMSRALGLKVDQCLNCLGDGHYTDHYGDELSCSSCYGAGYKFSKPEQ